MKTLNLIHKSSNPRLKILLKEKSNKFNFISIIKAKKKNSIKLYNVNSKNKSHNNVNKKSNITINNSINHIVNNITINNNSINHSKNYYTKNNNSLSKPKETNLQNFQSYMDKKNLKIDISIKKPSMLLSRNAHNSFSNNSNKSSFYLSLKHKLKKNPSFQNKRNNLKNKALNYKMKLFLKIPNNNNLNLQNLSNNICNRSKTNNISIYNNTNNSINENAKNIKHNSRLSTTNHSTNFTKKSLYKKKSNVQQKEIMNNKINIFAYANNQNFNKFSNLNKNNSNIKNNNILYGDYILNKILQNKAKNKNKNISINLKKFKTRGNSQSMSNNINNLNNNHSNTNSNIQISRYVNNFMLNKNKQKFKNVKDESSKNRIHSSNYDIDDIEKNNVYTNTNEFVQDEKIEKRKEKENKDSSLDETIKFSKCSSKVEEEGELGLDEVKDIIVYYNLNNIRNTNFIFKKNDYNEFLQNRKFKYLNFFLK